MKKTIRSTLTAVLLAVAVAMPALAAPLSAEAEEICRLGLPQEITEAFSTGKFAIGDRDADGNTPLMIIAKLNPFTACTEAAIKAGSDINARNSEARTPLMLASECNHSDKVIDLLCKAGADVNAYDRRGISALMLAVQYGSLDVCNALIKNGADVNAADVQGRTVRDYAFAGRAPEIISMIREKTSQKPAPAKKKP